MHPPARDGAFENPRSQAIATALDQLTKTLRATRVYARNNEMLERHLNRAHELLTAAFGDPASEIDLVVREDALLYQKDPVLEDGDRELGLPFILYRNSFRRLTLVPGMDKEELLALLGAIATDYSVSEFSGEELVTMLWRLALPHLRYVTIDALTVDKARADDPEDRVYIEELQLDIEAMVSRIYQTDAEVEDLVAGVSITKDDLEALKELRNVPEDQPEDLDKLTERAIFSLPRGHLTRFISDLQSDNKESLTARTIAVMLQVLFREPSAKETEETLKLTQELFDGLLLAGRLAEATAITEEIRLLSDTSDNLREVHCCRHLLLRFGSESRVGEVIGALNNQASPREVRALLRAFGPHISPALLNGLGVLNTPSHRRMILSLVEEFGVPSGEEIVARMEGAQWFVLRDLVSLLQSLPEAEAMPGLEIALSHEHPKVRVAALSALRSFSCDGADPYLIAALSDDDEGVRLVTYRLLAARDTQEAVPILERRLAREDLEDCSPIELSLLMGVYTLLYKERALSRLDKLLNQGFFSGLRRVSVQMAAVSALGQLGLLAEDALKRGTRSLSHSVREACRNQLKSLKNRGKGQSLDEVMSLSEMKTVSYDEGQGTGDLDEALALRKTMARALERSNSRTRAHSALREPLEAIEDSQSLPEISQVQDTPEPSQSPQDDFWRPLESTGSMDVLPGRLPPPPSVASESSMSGEWSLDGLSEIPPFDAPDAVDMVAEAPEADAELEEEAEEEALDPAYLEALTPAPESPSVPIRAGSWQQSGDVLNSRDILPPAWQPWSPSDLNTPTAPPDAEAFRDEAFKLESLVRESQSAPEALPAWFLQGGDADLGPGDALTPAPDTQGEAQSEAMDEALEAHLEALAVPVPVPIQPEWSVLLRQGEPSARPHEAEDAPDDAEEADAFGSEEPTLGLSGLPSTGSLDAPSPEFEDGPASDALDAFAEDGPASEALEALERAMGSLDIAAPEDAPSEFEDRPGTDALDALERAMGSLDIAASEDAPSEFEDRSGTDALDALERAMGSLDIDAPEEAQAELSTGSLKAPSRVTGSLDVLAPEEASLGFEDAADTGSLDAFAADGLASEALDALERAMGSLDLAAPEDASSGSLDIDAPEEAPAELSTGSLKAPLRATGSLDVLAPEEASFGFEDRSGTDALDALERAMGSLDIDAPEEAPVELSTGSLKAPSRVTGSLDVDVPEDFALEALRAAAPARGESDVFAPAPTLEVSTAVLNALARATSSLDIDVSDEASSGSLDVQALTRGTGSLRAPSRGTGSLRAPPGGTGSIDVDAPETVSSGSLDVQALTRGTGSLRAPVTGASDAFAAEPTVEMSTGSLKAPAPTVEMSTGSLKAPAPSADAADASELESASESPKPLPRSRSRRRAIPPEVRNLEPEDPHRTSPIRGVHRRPLTQRSGELPHVSDTPSPSSEAPHASQAPSSSEVPHASQAPSSSEVPHASQAPSSSELPHASRAQSSRSVLPAFPPPAPVEPPAPPSRTKSSAPPPPPPAPSTQGTQPPPAPPPSPVSTIQGKRPPAPPPVSTIQGKRPPAPPPPSPSTQGTQPPPPPAPPPSPVSTIQGKRPPAPPPSPVSTIQGKRPPAPPPAPVPTTQSKPPAPPPPPQATALPRRPPTPIDLRAPVLDSESDGQFEGSDSLPDIDMLEPYSGDLDKPVRDQPSVRPGDPRAAEETLGAPNMGTRTRDAISAWSKKPPKTETSRKSIQTASGVRLPPDLRSRQRGEHPASKPVHEALPPMPSHPDLAWQIDPRPSSPASRSKSHAGANPPLPAAEDPAALQSAEALAPGEHKDAEPSAEDAEMARLFQAYLETDS